MKLSHKLILSNQNTELKKIQFLIEFSKFINKSHPGFDFFFFDGDREKLSNLLFSDCKSIFVFDTLSLIHCPDLKNDILRIISIGESQGKYAVVIYTETSLRQSVLDRATVSRFDLIWLI